MADNHSILPTFGVIEKRPLASVPAFASAQASLMSYTWSPGAEILCQVSAELTLAFQSLLPDGSPIRLAPVENYTLSILKGSISGQAILAARGQLDQAESMEYHMARVMYQRGLRLRERFRRNLLKGKLSVTAAGRFDEGEKTILPEHLGLDAHGEGTPWGIRELEREGLEAALASGIENPSNIQIRQHGLHSAARRNPLPADHDTVRAVIRMGLFALGQDDGINSESLEIVRERLRLCLDRRLDDKDRFDEWLADRKSSLNRGIKKGAGRSLSRPQIRLALGQLVWESFLLVARSFGAFAQDFLDTFPDPLTDHDRDLFELVYVGTNRMGGIPLLMMFDRFPFLREGLLAVWNNPNDEQQYQVLFRLIEYYATMMEKRRHGDRQYKQRANAAKVKGKAVKTLPLPDADTSDSDARSPGISGVAADRRVAQVSELKGAVYYFASSELQAALDLADWTWKLLESDENWLLIELCCNTANLNQQLKISRKQFEEKAKELANED